MRGQTTLGVEAEARTGRRRRKKKEVVVENGQKGRNLKEAGAWKSMSRKKRKRAKAQLI